jgi:hypothetical protein
MTSSDDQSDETEIHFQEAHGARLFRKGTPRAILEVKSSHIPTEIHEARLRGYDEAKERSAVSKPEARVTRRAETFGRVLTEKFGKNRPCLFTPRAWTQCSCG